MFSLQQSDEMIYHDIPFSISLRNQQDLIVDLHNHVTMEGNPNLAASKAKKRQEEQKNHMIHPALGAAKGVEYNKNAHMYKKWVHRENEKKRREDLSKLYASLGNLLPPKSVQGKRSMLDCTDEAVSYIKQMQEKIETLSVKRDQLKKFEDMSINTVSIFSSCNDRSFEIQINSCSIEDGFLLSEILKALIKEGLDVINYTSRKINNRLLHSIQSEANNHTTLPDLSILQERLTFIANNWPEFN